MQNFLQLFKDIATCKTKDARTILTFADKNDILSKALSELFKERDIQVENTTALFSKERKLKFSSVQDVDENISNVFFQKVHDELKALIKKNTKGNDQQARNAHILSATQTLDYNYEIFMKEFQDAISSDKKNSAWEKFLRTIKIVEDLYKKPTDVKQLSQNIQPVSDVTIPSIPTEDIFQFQLLNFSDDYLQDKKTKLQEDLESLEPHKKHPVRQTREMVENRIAEISKLIDLLDIKHKVNEYIEQQRELIKQSESTENLKECITKEFGINNLDYLNETNLFFRKFIIEALLPEIEQQINHLAVKNFYAYLKEISTLVDDGIKKISVQDIQIITKQIEYFEEVLRRKVESFPPTAGARVNDMIQDFVAKMHDRLTDRLKELIDEAICKMRKQINTSNQGEKVKYLSDSSANLFQEALDFFKTILQTSLELMKAQIEKFTQLDQIDTFLKINPQYHIACGLHQKFNQTFLPKQVQLDETVTRPTSSSDVEFLNFKCEIEELLAAKQNELEKKVAAKSPTQIFRDQISNLHQEHANKNSLTSSTDSVSTTKPRVK
jgi:hypothetical protein